MDGKLSLNPEDVQVQSFTTSQRISSLPANSWPDVCTCIGICQPTADIYCSGGCPPETTIPVVE